MWVRVSPASRSVYRPHGGRHSTAGQCSNIPSTRRLSAEVLWGAEVNHPGHRPWVSGFGSSRRRRPWRCRNRVAMRCELLVPGPIVILALVLDLNLRFNLVQKPSRQFAIWDNVLVDDLSFLCAPATSLLVVAPLSADSSASHEFAKLGDVHHSILTRVDETPQPASQKHAHVLGEKGELHARLRYSSPSTSIWTKPPGTKIH